MNDWRFSAASEGRYFDDGGRPVDAFGRRLPYRLNARRYLAATGVLRAFDTRVPAAYVAEEVTEDEYFAVVRCVCGARPTIHLGGVHVCEGACGRAFLYEGAPGINGRRAVFAARFANMEGIEDWDADESPDGRS